MPESKYFQLLTPQLCGVGCSLCPDTFTKITLPTGWKKKPPGAILAGNWHRDGYIIFRVLDTVATIGNFPSTTTPKMPKWFPLQTPEGWTNRNHAAKDLDPWQLGNREEKLAWNQ